VPLTSGRGRVGGLVRTLLDDAGKHSLLLHHRRRRHLAVLSCILAVSVFGYLLLQPRKVHVQADGRDVDVQTLASNDHAVLRTAGVRLNPGDRVTLLDGGGIDVLRVDRARSVTLRVDGTTYRMRTHALTIDQLLSEADVAITGRDSVLQNGALVSMNAPVDPPRLFATRGIFGDDTQRAPGDVSIDVRRAVPFTIVENGAESASSSSRPTIAQALREAGLVIGPGDAVVPDLQAALDADTRVEVRHARAVTIALPDGHEVLYTLAQTVGEVLEEAHITLPEGAFVDPSFDTPVTAGMSVRVVQLSATSDFEREFIESRTLYKSDESLPPGEIRTVKGHDGALVRRYDVTYVNGEEVGRELLEEFYDPEPADTVVYYPTRTGRNDAQPADSGTVSKTLRVYATYYTPASSGRDASDPAYGITASGRVVTYGIVAVDPNVIPLGTRMFIPGYGYAIAADTGGAVKGYIVDLGFPDGVAIDWQPKWLDIYILS
jgi:uncharacterized protein YabE (DUF348 family)